MASLLTSTAAPVTPTPPARDASEPAVRLRDVVARRGGTPVLRVAHLDLPGGAVSAVVGPNGSGKSTLLHVVAGLLPGVQGQVRVLGRRPAEVRRRVAYVLQATAVSSYLPVTVREVVAMGRYAVPSAERTDGSGGRGRGRRARHRAVVDAAIERLELGGLTRRYLGELSGGQRQRVLVAQGLAQEGDVLLLDEPVAGLDLASAERIAAIVAEERAAGHAVVVATHDLTEAMAADHVALLAGRVVAAGAPGEVLTRGHLAEAYGDRLLRVGDDLLVVDDGEGHFGGGHCQAPEAAP
ncbi:MAG TPA: metal ABC transporter ATP-binding protein [Acidimicrobiales bacterium]|nr:metal ABC transporter ATP-binding protein [Acidimicrobiales bacterium]